MVAQNHANFHCVFPKVCGHRQCMQNSRWDTPSTISMMMGTCVLKQRIPGSFNHSGREFDPAEEYYSDLNTGLSINYNEVFL